MKKIQLSNKQITIFLHVLFWITVLILPLFFGNREGQYLKVGGLPASFFLVSGVICILLFYTNAYILYPKICNKRYWWLYLLCLVLLFAGFNYLKVFILKNWYPQIDIFGLNAPFIFAPTFFALLTSTAYRFIANRIQAEKMLRIGESEKLAMELKFLRSQINPHFLFNVLSSLVSLARKKSDRLEPSLILLSDMMRYMIYDSNDKKVSLESEVTYLESYIALQQLRFDDSVPINASLELDSSSDHLLIEPMLLIPFVENAFKHGTGWINGPAIKIHLRVESKILVFNVENRFNGTDTQKDTAGGIGLVNVKSRLNLLYPGRHQLTSSIERNTFIVHLRIQLQ